MTKPWEKQDDETLKAYNAFCVYRDMPAHLRSLKKVAEAIYNGVSTGKQRYIEHWSSNNNWVKRVEAYDIHLDEINRREHEEAIKEMNKRQAQIGADMQAKGWEGISSNDPTLDEGRRLVETGAKLERTARGEPSEISKTEGGIKIIFEDVEAGERVKNTED